MRLILLFFITLLNISCNETSPNLINASPEKIQREDKSPLCIKEFVDGAHLGAPKLFPDEVTKNALAHIKKSSKDLKLAIGVSNINQEVQRFRKECGDWVFLDTFGVANGPAFFHIDLGELESLTKLADEVEGKFSLIAIDYSVTRLVNNFGFASIFQIMRMLKKNGTLHLWHDEPPFLDNSEIKDAAQINVVIDLIKRNIEILDRALSSPNLNVGFFGPLENLHSFKYSFSPELSAADRGTFEDVVREHAEKKTEVLKKLFLQKNIQFEVKENGFPLPVGAFDYTNLPYLTLTKLK